VGNVIAPVGAGGAVLGAIVSWLTSRGFGRWLFGLGQQDEGLECLEKACEERDVWLVWLKAEPRFDSLRSGPRFENLLRRISLVP